MTTAKRLGPARPIYQGREPQIRLPSSNLAPLHTVESDVAPLNFSLATAYQRAQSRQAWKSLVERQRPLDKPRDNDDVISRPVG